MKLIVLTLTLATAAAGFLPLEGAVNSTPEVGILLLWGGALLVIASRVRRAAAPSPAVTQVRQARMRPSTQELKVGA